MPASVSVTLIANTGITVTCPLDAGSPVLTDGFGGWETVDRPKRPGITRFKGKSPFKQDIAILFDGWIEGTSQEHNITTLMRMGEQPGDLQEPPKIRLIGMALRKDLIWVIDSLDFDSTNVIWDFSASGSPVRVRQAVTIHLLQYVPDSIVTTPAAPSVTPGTAKPTRITTPHGMTGKQLAQLYYGSPDQWYKIIWANPQLDHDSRKLIPSGTKISIPDPKTNIPRTITVP
jgi:hypothetical protein